MGFFYFIINGEEQKVCVTNLTFYFGRDRHVKKLVFIFYFFLARTRRWEGEQKIKPIGLNCCGKINVLF